MVTQYKGSLLTQNFRTLGIFRITFHPAYLGPSQLIGYMRPVFVYLLENPYQFNHDT
jgi:hypothetical protein